jgi:hypothetical protein
MQDTVFLSFRPCKAGFSVPNLAGYVYNQGFGELLQKRMCARVLTGHRFFIAATGFKLY